MSSNNFYYFIDSRNKIYESNADFSISESDFNLEPGVSVSIALDECVFYNTQYPINSNNNTFIFQENDTATNITATLTPGNYTGSSIATELQTQMNSVGSNTYSVSYDSGTGKLIISETLPDNFKLVSINEIFGFEIMTSFEATRTGDNPAVLSGVEYVDLMLPSLISNNVSTNNNRNGIIKRIPLDLPWGSLIVYKSQESDQSVIINKEYLNNIQVRLLNPDGTVFDLRENSHLSIVLKCTYQL